ncbi:hypothetical protein ACF07V_21710 [Streptomyces sp. NPDC015661]|uniref:hypothetical protein n=1 Tax=Streptomyces sp. NPDC015661 TaxID=3364961 RepID=UPI0036F98C1F
MPTTEELAEPAEREEPEEAPLTRKERRRRGIAVAAVLLLACGAFGTYRLLGSERSAAPGQGAPVAAADVTYEVLGEGSADISYRGTGGEKEVVVRNATLPWKKAVSVPVGAAPLVHVTLGEKGGTASCALAVHGRHVQRATATGAFGRTTCGGGAPVAAEGAR